MDSKISHSAANIAITILNALGAAYQILFAKP